MQHFFSVHQIFSLYRDRMPFYRRVVFYFFSFFLFLCQCVLLILLKSIPSNSYTDEGINSQHYTCTRYFAVTNYVIISEKFIHSARALHPNT